LRRFSAYTLLVCFLVSACGAMLCAAGQGAGDAVPFLRSGVGARAQALGGAFSAFAQGYTATLWNPAGHAYESGYVFGGSYESRFGGLVSIQSLGVAAGWDDFGAGLLYVSSDMYNVLFLSGGWGGKSFSVGGGAKGYWIQEGANSAQGLGFDVGVRGRLLAEEGVTLSVALVSQDIGWSAIRWRGPGPDFVDYAAWVTRLGAALRLDGPWGPWVAAADIEAALRRPPREDEDDYLDRALQTALRLGTELWVYSIAGRAGLVVTAGETPGVPSLRPIVGVGVEVAGVEVDAALSGGALGIIYSFSTQARF